MLYFYKNNYKYFYYIINVLKSDKLLIYRVLLFIILGIFICIFIFFIVLICKDIHDKYVFALCEGKINFNKCVL